MVRVRWGERTREPLFVGLYHVRLTDTLAPPAWFMDPTRVRTTWSLSMNPSLTKDRARGSSPLRKLPFRRVFRRGEVPRARAFMVTMRVEIDVEAFHESPIPDPGISLRMKVIVSL